MTKRKTRPHHGSVTDLLDSIQDEVRQADCRALAELMQRVTGDPGRRWGEAIVGFGTTTKTYANGSQAEWFQIGFASRKQDLTLYLYHGFRGCSRLLNRLGKHRTGKCCLYIKRLSEIDLGVLEELLQHSVR